MRLCVQRISSSDFWLCFQVDFELTLENSDETADTPLSGIVRETLTGSDFIQRDFQIETASWYARGVVVPASFAKVR